MDNLAKSIILTPFNLLYKISPKLDLKILFRLKLGCQLDLKNLVTYNEKSKCSLMNFNFAACAGVIYPSMASSNSGSLSFMEPWIKDSISKEVSSGFSRILARIF